LKVDARGQRGDFNLRKNTHCTGKERLIGTRYCGWRLRKGVNDKGKSVYERSFEFLDEKDENARKKQDAIKQDTEHSINIGSHGPISDELSQIFVREETAPRLIDCSAEKSKMSISLNNGSKLGILRV